MVQVCQTYPTQKIRRRAETLIPGGPSGGLEWPAPRILGKGRVFGEREVFSRYPLLERLGELSGPRLVRARRRSVRMRGEALRRRRLVRMLRVLGRGRSWRGRRRRREHLFLERARHRRDGGLDRREIRRENLRREKILKADAVERCGILDRRRGHRLYAGDVSIEEGSYDEPDAGGGTHAPVGYAEHF